MYLTRRMAVAEEAAREDRDQVLLVVDVRHGGERGVRVEVVCERLVADSGEAVPDVRDLEAGDVEREVDCAQERDRATCMGRGERRDQRRR